ncbi:leukotriene-A4 hydrolase [Sporothrix schenckii 1099-18]|uniref:Leukotriene-A4 hydrolase n=1 Tax=Sporothrix schenckii 1099-18 TaxID=1397361 RepID=A0A0F2MLV0_SPOSC|nr:leukotriene-A4 hydrolase [Sporothrix schenckii 1099-18]KJR89161.1 leukotriene-A4 hydrolase [Sporothrix schenckii 1099-18]
MGKRDANTASNYHVWRNNHTTATLKIDFDAQVLRGHVVQDFSRQPATDGEDASEIILDTSSVDVKAVSVDGKAAPFEVKPRAGPLGEPLHIRLPAALASAPAGTTVRVRIDVSTTAACTALQWLTPAQTSNKKAPFMFSQAQAIHARSLFPCQDSPDVKSTYSFRIASPHPVVASGLTVTDARAQQAAEDDDILASVSAKDTLYVFEQKVPIPAYLFALASGDIVTAPIGARSVVATSPDQLKACQWELEQDMPKYLDVIEKLVFPYAWGEYNVLILPPSFPYGGMENPIFTFATPTIISGDRQNVDVIAHELSHSWSGNLVTSSSWEHYWLNEGWTVYLERRIVAAIHGDAYFDFSAVIGWKALEGAVQSFGPSHDYTKLLINHDGIDPDDAFSTVPYEKGFHMVYYLERLVGRANFDKFIPYYFTKWSGKSLDSYEFRDTFLEFFAKPEFASLKDAVAGIDWEGRFHTPGLPPKPQFDTSLIDVCYQLAEQWKAKDFVPSPKDVGGWTANQVIVFLGEIQSFTEPITADQSQRMGAAYGLVDTQNVEVKAAYYVVSLRAQDKSTYQGTADLLGTVGRMKFVRSLYRALNQVDRPLALATFEKNRDFYHPICKAMVEKDLSPDAMRT